MIPLQLIIVSMLPRLMCVKPQKKTGANLLSTRAVDIVVAGQNGGSAAVQA